jgi:hypothetical protein
MRDSDLPENILLDEVNLLIRTLYYFTKFNTLLLTSAKYFFHTTLKPAWPPRSQRIASHPFIGSVATLKPIVGIILLVSIPFFPYTTFNCSREVVLPGDFCSILIQFCSSRKFNYSTDVNILTNPNLQLKS